MKPEINPSSAAGFIAGQPSNFQSHDNLKLMRIRPQHRQPRPCATSYSLLVHTPPIEPAPLQRIAKNKTRWRAGGLTIGT